MKPFAQSLISAGAAFLYMSISATVALADDTEIYVGLTPKADKKTNPNVLLVLDTSGSMSSGVTGTTCTAGSTIIDLCDGSGRNAKLSRLGVVKLVTAELINELKADGKINFGLMRFDMQAQGGMITYPIAPITDGADTIIQRLNRYRANGNTPLSETLYEAARYYRGDRVYYGLTSSTKDTEGSNPPTVFTPSVRQSYTGSNITEYSNLSTSYSRNNAKYISPIESSCQKNHIIYLTDGAPTGDTDASDAIRSLTGKSCGNNNGECMDELSEYLFEEDQSSIQDGKQTVTTHTIGFFEDSPLLESTATRGGGKYYTADDVSGLIKSLRTILNEILAQNTTFTTPTVSVSAYNNIGYRNELYYALFRPAQGSRWPGNVKRYKLGKDANGAAEIQDANGRAAISYSGDDAGFFKTTAQSWWSPTVDGADVSKGGASSQLTTPTTRKLYTYTGAELPPGSTSATLSSYPLVTGTAGNHVTATMLGDQNMTAQMRTQIINWARGNELDKDGNVVGNNLFIGDLLHNEPKLVSYRVDNSTTTPQETLYMFFGTNQGGLHAVDPTNGAEKFAFIPKELLPNLKDYYQNPQGVDTKRYGLDGHITVWVEYADAVANVRSANRVNVIAGMRRGGRNYYALNVLDIDSPKLKWVIKGGTGGTTGFEKLGQTWSAAKLAKVKWNGAIKPVLFFSGGYDPTQDNDSPNLPRNDSYGNALYMVDADTGSLLWRAGHTSETGANLTISTMTNSIPGGPTLVDITGDGLVDTMFMADMRGQVFRFDIRQNNTGAANFATGGRIARLGDDNSITSDDSASSNRRFYYAPDVSLVRERGGNTYYTIALGSGWREHPLNETTVDRFYALRDRNVLSAPTTYATMTEANMVDATGVNLSDAEYEQTKQEIDQKLALIEQYNTAAVTAEANFDQYKVSIGHTAKRDALLAKNTEITTLRQELDTLGATIDALESELGRIAPANDQQTQVVETQGLVKDLTDKLVGLKDSAQIAAITTIQNQLASLYNTQLSIQGVIATKEAAIQQKQQAIAATAAAGQPTATLQQELVALQEGLYGRPDDPDTTEDDSSPADPNLTMRTALISDTNSAELSTLQNNLVTTLNDLLLAMQNSDQSQIDQKQGELTTASNALNDKLGSLGISNLSGSNLAVSDLLARDETTKQKELAAQEQNLATSISNQTATLDSRTASLNTAIAERDVIQGEMDTLAARPYDASSNLLTSAQLADARANDADGTLTWFEAYNYLLLAARGVAQSQIPTLRDQINQLYASLSPGNSYTVNSDLLNGSDGWFIRLAPGEKVLSASITLQGALFFNTFLPTGQTAGCAPDVGTSRLYATNLVDGSALYQQTVDGESVPIRSVNLVRPGIAPSPTVIPTTDGSVLISGTEVDPFKQCALTNSCVDDVPVECRKDVPFCRPGNNIQPTYWREQ
ncbi:pilus assembly protein PilY [Metapseudomonas lalkuanensis]|uniref:Pilus assembly protein PilY n=1 Tax=Metapseudomonas lalkuanensis TaxID=2604832 RepID=A0A5J6QKF3_9GAMM|nr:PilC/PilY family type IV pilus protein [Pseudomonas lalkuanensis]QEY61306.1 pilus assembly protein PilY [Pseudomonas lalkuanensis]